MSTTDPAKRAHASTPDGTVGPENRRVRTSNRAGRVRSAAPTAAQRLAQRQLVGLFELTDVRVDQNGVRLNLTRGATELPTWLDTLDVPYQVGTQRRRRSSQPGALDMVILIEWADLPALARWIPAIAVRLQALRPSHTTKPTRSR